MSGQDDPPKGRLVTFETVASGESGEFSLERAFSDPVTAAYRRIFVLDEIAKAPPDVIPAWCIPELKQIARELLQADPIILGKYKRERKGVTVANILGFCLRQGSGKPSGREGSGKANGRVRALRYYRAASRVMFPPPELSEWTQRTLTKQKNLKDLWRF